MISTGILLNQQQFVIWIDIFSWFVNLKDEEKLYSMFPGRDLIWREWHWTRQISRLQDYVRWAYMTFSEPTCTDLFLWISHIFIQFRIKLVSFWFFLVSLHPCHSTTDQLITQGSHTWPLSGSNLKKIGKMLLWKNCHLNF